MGNCAVLFTPLLLVSNNFVKPKLYPMKSFKHLLLLLLSVSMVSITACKKDDDDSDTTESELPDAVFSADISGDVTRHVEFTLPKNVATTDGRAINGSQNNSLNLLLINALGGSEKWTIALGVTANSVTTGTFQMNQTQTSFGSYTDQDAGVGYLSTSGSVTITKAELYQSVGSSLGGADDYFIDGTFTMSCADESNPPQEITVTGSFSGINIKDN